MDLDGRYDHLEDVLIRLHEGQWFGWSDTKNKVYANLIIHPKIADGIVGMKDNPNSKPTEKSLTDALATQQSDFDAQEYARNRATEYPALAEQLDEIYHNGIDSWKAVIKVTKDKYPKG
jgi:hypothetical protein